MRVVTVLRLKVASICLIENRRLFTYFKVIMGNVSPFVQINITITTIGKNVAPLSVDSFILEKSVMVPKPVLNVRICRFNLANQIEM